MFKRLIYFFRIYYRKHHKKCTCNCLCCDYIDTCMDDDIEEDDQE